MNKKELLAMPKLKVTPSMHRAAMADKPEIIRYSSTYEKRSHKIAIYLRCCTKNDILKVACFTTEDIRTGSKSPMYEIYFSKEEKDYLTYEPEKKRWLTGSFWRLTWPTYFYNGNINVCSETQKTIRKYFGGDMMNAVTLISRFQNDIMDERLKKKHKKVTDPWDEDLKQTPTLPKEFGKWIGKYGIPEKFIFYNYSPKKKLQKGFCTYCERDVEVPAKHNDVGKCPHCKKTVTFKCLTRFKRHFTERYSMYLFQKCKDGFMVREFTGYRFYTPETYKDPEVRYYEGRRVIGDKDGILQRAYYYDNYKTVGTRWIASNICSYNYRGNYSGKIYPYTLPSLFKKELKTTGLKEYYQKRMWLDPEKFLAAYKRFPYMEKFAKVGLTRLIDEITNNGRAYYYSTFLGELDLDSSQNSVIKVLKLTPQAFRRFRECNGGRNILIWLQHESLTGKEIPNDTIDWLIKNKLEPARFKFIGNRMSVLQIVHYLQRQMTESGMNLQETLTTWSDYLSMALRLGYDVNDEIVYRTRKLKQRHDELVDLCNSKDDAIRAAEIIQTYPNIEDNLSAIKERYEYAAEDYTVIVPTKIEQILSEGRALHHCVANIDKYWDRIERNESYVFFLRKSQSPGQAYYTLEVEPGGTVRQKRTMYDRQEKDIDAASDFLRRWQHEIHSRMTKKDKELAKTSRVLRLENFKELTEKNVIINTGQLQGQRLVDVLMADLMEVA